MKIKIFVCGLEFISTKDLKKCNKCNLRGVLYVKEDNGTTYMPFCNCEYGSYLKTKQYYEEQRN